MVDWLLSKLNFKLSDSSGGQNRPQEDYKLKPLEHSNKGLEELDAETPDDHRMLDDLE